MADIGMVRQIGDAPCDHPKCVDGWVRVRNTSFMCPRCAGTGRMGVYVPTGRTVTIQGVESRVVTRSEHLGDG